MKEAQEKLRERTAQVAEHAQQLEEAQQDARSKCARHPDPEPSTLISRLSVARTCAVLYLALRPAVQRTEMPQSGPLPVHTNVEWYGLINAEARLRLESQLNQRFNKLSKWLSSSPLD